MLVLPISQKASVGFPDYRAYVTLEQPTRTNKIKTFVLPKDGWILFHGHGNVMNSAGHYINTDSSCAYGYINGKIVFHHHLDGTAFNSSSQFNSQEMVMAPAKRGDIATAVLETGGMFWYFIPNR